MSLQQLPAETVDEVVTYLARFLDDESITPGAAGKKAFLKAAMQNPEFFPDGLRAKIKEHKDGMSLGTYLFSHDPVQFAYGRYFSQDRSAEY